MELRLLETHNQNLDNVHLSATLALQQSPTSLDHLLRCEIRTNLILKKWTYEGGYTLTQ